ncbi:DUF397 domain-containing protein [Nocardiopsis sp. JB363]|uniref:DUF397 domain-containing protein n=1 Tax=Nocardiopsis sp. JB363 TaxID=1434837 RepID=UPI00097A7A09|nr:DUF397 domain-containing protein [Nocardiopsis sp. JB363]SIO90001.1 protein of unknown function DUF397 [Nocardiopsis sp. JB363]
MTRPIPADLFRTSSYTQQQNCVEVADLPDGSAVRDTQHRQAGYLMFTSGEWVGLVGTVKAARVG